MCNVNMREYLNKKIVMEIIFLVSFAILPVLLGYYGGLLAIFLLVIILLLGKNLEGSNKIYQDKKLLVVFIIVYSILIINIFFTAFGLYKHFEFNEEYIKYIIKIVSLTLSLVLLKIYICLQQSQPF